MRDLAAIELRAGGPNLVGIGAEGLSFAEQQKPNRVALKYKAAMRLQDGA